MNVGSVHSLLYHTLSDDDATAELHMHAGMVWHRSLCEQP